MNPHNRSDMKYHLLIFLFLTAIACHPATRKKTTASYTPIEVETIHIDSSDFDMCSMAECPPVRVDYIHFQGESRRAEEINEENIRFLSVLFHEYIREETEISPTVPIAVAAFIREYLNFKVDYPQSVAIYETITGQTMLSQNPQRIVVETQFYFYTGGAHGMNGTIFHNYDSQTGRLLTTEDLFSDWQALTAHGEKIFRAQFDVPSDASLNDHGFFFEDDRFVLPDNVAVLPDKVVFLYNPYEAASYAQGQIRLEMPVREIGQWLK